MVVCFTLFEEGCKQITFLQLYWCLSDINYLTQQFSGTFLIKTALLFKKVKSLQYLQWSIYSTTGNVAIKIYREDKAIIIFSIELS